MYFKNQGLFACPFIISSNSITVEMKDSMTHRQKLSPTHHCLTVFRLWWLTWNEFNRISETSRKLHYKTVTTMLSSNIERSFSHLSL